MKWIKTGKLSVLFVIVCILCCSCAVKAASSPSPQPVDTVQEGKSGESVISVTEPETNEPETTEPDLTEPETTKPIVVSETKTLRFTAAGDNIIYLGTWYDAGKGLTKGTYNFQKMYQNVCEDIEQADVAFINQETLMCGDGYDLTAYPRFNSPQKAGLDLLSVGFDIIGIANNHMADYGADGLEATIRFWKSVTDQKETLMVGGYENQTDYNTIRYYEKNGIVLAMLAYTEMVNQSVDAKTPVVPLMQESVIAAQVAEAKKHADVVIVAAHWGTENSFTPSVKEKKWAQYMADCGVDIIIGAHPHVIQPVVWLEGASGNRTLCAYSLGNFLAEQAEAKNILGGLFSFSIVKTDGKITITDVVMKPTVCHVDNKWNNVIYYLEDYTQELCDQLAVTTYYKNGKVTMEQLWSFYYSAIDEEFRP